MIYLFYIINIDFISLKLTLGKKLAKMAAATLQRGRLYKRIVTKVWIVIIWTILTQQCTYFVILWTVVRIDFLWRHGPSWTEKHCWCLLQLNKQPLDVFELAASLILQSFLFDSQRICQANTETPRNFFANFFGKKIWNELWIFLL